jgi:hypothetical protein
MEWQKNPGYAGSRAATASLPSIPVRVALTPLADARAIQSSAAGTAQN